MSSTAKAGLAFAVVTAAWIFVLLHGTLGFGRPHDTHGVIANVLHAIVWILFLYCGWNLISKLRARDA